MRISDANEKLLHRGKLDWRLETSLVDECMRLYPHVFGAMVIPASILVYYHDLEINSQSIKQSSMTLLLILVVNLIC